MIKVRNAGDCCIITLARPDKANALTEAMLEGLASAATDAATNDAKVLMLTGEGKVFSAGADLEGMKGRPWPTPPPGRTPPPRSPPSPAFPSPR